MILETKKLDMFSRLQKNDYLDGCLTSECQPGMRPISFFRNDLLCYAISTYNMY